MQTLIKKHFEVNPLKWFSGAQIDSDINYFEKIENVLFLKIIFRMKNLNTRAANVIPRKLLFHTASAGYQGL